jgi:hypothetical protein
LPLALANDSNRFELLADALAETILAAYHQFVTFQFVKNTKNFHFAKNGHKMKYDKI